MTRLNHVAAGLACVLLLVSSGCLNGMDPSSEPGSDAAENEGTVAPPNVSSQNDWTRTTVNETVTWSEARARPWPAPTGPAQPIGSNCVVLQATENATIQTGVVTVNWGPPDVSTDRGIHLVLWSNSYQQYKEHVLTPRFHANKDYSVNVSGWSLAGESPIDLAVAFMPPDQDYVGYEHTASVTIHLEHSGEIEDILLGSCS